ncbi:6702_t:CDS:2 [Cetraspora pellucida]|uniref:6702_t:CDS:1 n=1 Tax=Cetraspora pellucida TaxID=1433469 RepID=A0A9N9FQD6_9GLOM|nr:6702_t:CDS:2 [Cetraspora pellucida]
MVQKNEGPCSVQNCDTKTGSYALYNYLIIGQQLCYNYYMRIVKPDKYKK